MPRRSARGEIVRVRVGVTQTAAAEIMPAALRAFRDDHPGVEVVLVAADDPDSSRAALRRGDLDLAFSYNSEADARTIVLCYPRRRPVTATARSLITAIRAQAARPAPKPLSRLTRAQAA